MLSAKQLEERKEYIGGSDAAIICGLSPFRNVIDLWQEKVGQVEAPDLSENPYVKAGNFLEKAIINWFESETGFVVWKPLDTMFHRDHKFMAANVDGIIQVDEGKSPSYILEVKTASSDKDWGETGTDQIPQHYRLQIAHYLAVYDLPKAYVAVLIRGVDFRYYVIERNEKLENVLIKREKAFWYCVENNMPPEPKTGEEIISLNGLVSLEESALADTDIQGCLDQIDKINFELSVLENAKKELTDKIKVFMGKSDTLLDISGKIAATWKVTKPSNRFDSEAFKTERPEEYSKYVRIYTNSRRFLLKK